MKKLLPGRRSLSVVGPLIALALPLTVFALDYTPNVPYKAGRAASKAAAAIHALTNLQIVEGHPTGHFGASRKIDRAEFLKMAMLAAESASGQATVTKAASCFPDVRQEDWFSGPVCRAADMQV